VLLDHRHPHTTLAELEKKKMEEDRCCFVFLVAAWRAASLLAGAHACNLMGCGFDFFL